MIYYSHKVEEYNECKSNSRKTSQESLTLSKLIRKFKLTNNEKNKLSEYLDYLEEQGLIFKSDDDKYNIMPSNYFVAELHFGAKKSAYVEIEGMKYDISKNNLKTSLDFDKVLVEILQKNKARIIKNIKRKNNKIVYEVKIKIKDGARKKYLEPSNSGNNLNITISNKIMKNLTEGERILVRLNESINDKEVPADFIEVIGHKDDPNIDLRCIALNHDFYLDFESGIKEETSKLPTKIIKEDIEGRLDLRDKMIFTIDGSKTKDMDDAISLTILPNGNYLLGIHIANVSNYIKKGSKLFEEAKKRATSLYMLNTVIPMFPHTISNGIC